MGFGVEHIGEPGGQVDAPVGQHVGELVEATWIGAMVKPIRSSQNAWYAGLSTRVLAVPAVLGGRRGTSHVRGDVGGSPAPESAWRLGQVHYDNYWLDDGSVRS